MILTHHKKVTRTAHYYTHGEASKNTRYCWIVCHGYGQLASRIIQKFEGFDPKTHLVIAPEALSSFYWNNVTGQVGASWMTKKDRLDEIDDYTNYIKGLYDEYVSQCTDNVKVILFGFSQGCATQMRWVMREFPIFHSLVLWAGLLPEDLDYTPYSSYFASKKIVFVCGNEDPFINQERIDWHRSFAEKQGFNMHVVGFEGKHKIKIECLEELFEKQIKEEE